MKILNGSCSCGEINFFLKKKPIITHACHCNLCRKLTGSAFIINVLIENWNLQVSKGKLKNFSGISGSGRKHIIKRCIICGDPIVSFYGETEYLAVVKGGLLENTKYSKPDAHVFLKSKLDWVVLDKNSKKFDKFYDFKQVLSKENYKRIIKIRTIKNNS